VKELESYFKSPPGLLCYVYEIFWKMRSMTASDQPIIPSELLAYITLIKVELSCYEIDMIFRLDGEYRMQMNKDKS